MPSLRRRRVIAVTGSPSPHNLVSPAARPPARPRRLNPNISYQESKDPAYLAEARADAEDHHDWAAWNDGMPLADFECRHGSLPEDPHVSCTCWGLPLSQLHEDLREARERLTNRPETALYPLVYGLGSLEGHSALGSDLGRM